MRKGYQGTAVIDADPRQPVCDVVDNLSIWLPKVSSRFPRHVKRLARCPVFVVVIFGPNSAGLLGENIPNPIFLAKDGICRVF
jgi:hypothetical protein